MSDLTAMDAATGDREATARLLAQWAVNVVDFRDRDSIMTPFEYDIDPFTDDDRRRRTGTSTDSRNRRQRRDYRGRLGLRAAGTADYRNAGVPRPADGGPGR